MRTFAVRLTNDQLTEIREMAKEEERTVSVIIRRLLNEAIREKRKLTKIEK